MEGVYNPEDPKHVARVVNDLVRQFDNTGSLTLNTSATSTVVMNPKVVWSTVPFLIPANANAKAEQWWIESVGIGQFTVGHASSTTARKFYYVLHGV
ncbi:hypothetical protein [Brucella anthropi]|uniref:hypothetical protein n=1 Tax=Brucella anthropi TaxID=529 RepID=UPI00044C080F|nr:hypothetical protein [Brucella anthropi]EXL04301.1 hypothetical protein BG46_25265 [Brucella anthropi]UVV67071.1 hypothetical protein NW321_11425 [Brucella anthropi]